MTITAENGQVVWIMTPNRARKIAAVGRPMTSRLSAQDRAVVADLRRAWTEAAHAYPGDRAVDDIFTLLDLLDSAFPPDPPEEN